VGGVFSHAVGMTPARAGSLLPVTVAVDQAKPTPFRQRQIARGISEGGEGGVCDRIPIDPERVHGDGMLRRLVLEPRARVVLRGGDGVQVILR